MYSVRDGTVSNLGQASAPESIQSFHHQSLPFFTVRNVVCVEFTLNVFFVTAVLP
jgi:hypothetical protein